jgi:hypothetical protein
LIAIDEGTSNISLMREKRNVTSLLVWEADGKWLL